MLAISPVSFVTCQELFHLHGRNFILIEQSLPLSVLGIFDSQHCYPVHGTGLVWIFPVHSIGWYLIFYNRLLSAPLPHPDIKKCWFRWRQRWQLGRLGRLEWLLPDLWGRSLLFFAEMSDWKVSGGLAAVWSVLVTVWVRRVVGMVWWFLSRGLLSTNSNWVNLKLTCLSGNCVTSRHVHLHLQMHLSCLHSGHRVQKNQTL